ncbi:lipoate--protein ligase family protein [Galactobacter valiniphilus]|uniref:Lipoate--protein ligase family protein n=1 Tax=Galactobacter valiniphilus TaxID=2676122 RepID=A0A399JKP1_9MICC|nr:lipoate--protein ligase family protein [Galactobacter valiniphilus]RII43086.1 lipoate--protein ligase family protein [Galactobacter valiniphilus]
MTDSTRLSLLRDHATGDAAADLDRSLGLLREVAAGHRGPLLRVYTPAPTLAFGQRDARLPGFEAAAAAAAVLGFAPVVRSAGGRAAAYHEGCLIIDQIQPEAEAMKGHQARFARFGELYASALASLGVDAAVGEIPGEYCPGEFSVHGTRHDGAARVKLVGTAQRVVAGAWLFSSVVVVSGAVPLREVTTRVYEELGLALDPATVGDAAGLVAPGAPVPTPTSALEAILATWAEAGYTIGE